MLMKSDNPRPGAATLIYGPNGFRVVRPGNFVSCAVSGEAVPLELLRYWSVERQEAYASAEYSTQAALGQR